MTLLQHLRSSARRHVAWLAALSLWLLLAQAAAAWHGHSHDSEPRLAHGAVCELCLAAAAVGAAALPVEAPVAVPVDAYGELPLPAAGIPAVLAAAERRYESRAPPFART